MNTSDRVISIAPIRRQTAFWLALIPTIALAILTTAPSASALTMSPPSNGFTGTSGTVIMTKSGITPITCTGASVSEGHVTSSTSGELSMVFNGCTWGSTSCTITSSKLTFKPVYLDAAHTKFGLLFAPKEGVTFATKKCGLLVTTWTGSLIGRVTSPALGVASRTSTVDFNAISAGQQEYQQIEGAGTKYYLAENGESLALDFTLTETFIEPNKYMP